MIKLASPSHYQGLQKAVKHNALMVLTVSRSTINTSHCTVWRKVRASQAEAAIEDIALVAAFAFVDGAKSRWFRPTHLDHEVAVVDGAHICMERVSHRHVAAQPWYSR
jgi:hypothetical protein